MKLAEDHPVSDGATAGMEARRSTILGARVKAYRSARRLTLRQLGDMVGTTASFLSQLERGLSGANTSTLMLIANALGISVADLFDETEVSPHSVLTRAERPALPVSEGYRKTLISRRPIQSVEIYSGEFAVGGSTGDLPYTHGDSHEIFIVLRGRLQLTLGSESFLLGEGDSIEYATSTPHKTVNVGDTPAEVLWIIAPPTSGAVDLDQYVARTSLASRPVQADSGSLEEE
ncbi:mannose-6-phosphate isomerase-like protein (cupin superfamily) [Mesorhizobium soli]|uniref:helix-turn-helix domain-containing protein n=1 Tax=Pseudaminobacter soli (ex Li et al. 2025) TaxID=1295366 RepID=UPI002476271C|nr:XRE family transcriptional regulator [Mesorhizobium soli]MDH6232381.1 mannose-6-phosphate isomerase-like protein (cupin superfamily) [Mesorhizobium soli]